MAWWTLLVLAFHMLAHMIKRRIKKIPNLFAVSGDRGATKAETIDVIDEETMQAVQACVS